MRCWLHAFEAGDSSRIARTLRSLRAAGLDPEIFTAPAALVASLKAAQESVLLVAAGAWLVHDRPFAPVPPSATGRPVVALGAVRDSPGAGQWSALFASHGGDFDRRSFFGARIPTPVAASLAPEAAHALAVHLATGHDWTDAWQRLLHSRTFRKVHFAPLDARVCRRMRILQVVTSIQMGGAERVALDLATELSRCNVAVAVASLGRPGRATFPKPARYFDLSHTSSDVQSRAEAVIKAAHRFGADLLHGHLLSAEEARALRAREIPLVLTLHNMPPGWPIDYSDGRGPMADLILGCSLAVTQAAQRADLHGPIRTVWNGIDHHALVRQKPHASVRSSWREPLGWAAEDFVLIALANPRRQKRLARLPAILTALQPRLPGRTVRLLLAGAVNPGSEDSLAAAVELDAAIAACPHAADIRQLGAVHEISEMLAAADVLISVGEYEGLSLAHLEAVAAGLPVVATDVGGTREIAEQCPALRLVAREASDDEVAAAVAEIATAPPLPLSGFPPSFQRHAMATRTLWFYRQLLAPRSPVQEGVWLVTNNLSTGGAQSSARRLLLGLAARGINVRAAVLEESPSRPTPGRVALRTAGIPVLAVPPPSVLTPLEASALVVEAISADRPQAVLFWNVMPVLKILIADSLLDVPIFDVSPGEMYFASLNRYFANPSPALPYRHAREYGARLAGVVVKYTAEAECARATLGAPVAVIPNGIALETPSYSPRGTTKLVLGTAARLSPDKRLGDLLEAVRLAQPRLPLFVLRIAGGVDGAGKQHGRVLRRAARGLPVEWCGELPDTRDFLAGLDLFVMISEPAGCPNASLEALNAGVPVIATDVGGTREQIIDGVCGRLVPPRDPVALADAIVALAGDPASRAAFASAGWTHLRNHFSLDRMLDSYTGFCRLATEPRTVTVAVEKAQSCFGESG
jgi:glycosyltransferase involved in cell wall biosynthesis